MASISLRSSARTGRLTTRSSRRDNGAAHPGNGNSDNNTYTTQQLSNIGRAKRPRDSADEEEQPAKAKKAKVAVEILPRRKALAKSPSRAIRSKANAHSGVPPQLSASQPKPTAALQTELNPPPRKHTNHRQNIARSIKHEIDRLQPSASDLKDEKRKLRSQEGSRFKSELSAYFPEYDEVIGNELKEDRKPHARKPLYVCC